MDVSWVRVGVPVPHRVTTATWGGCAHFCRNEGNFWLSRRLPLTPRQQGGRKMTGHCQSGWASRLPCNFCGPWVWEALLPADGGESSHSLLGLLRNHPSRDVGAPYSKPGNLCSPLGLCWCGCGWGQCFSVIFGWTQVVIFGVFCH